MKIQLLSDLHLEAQPDLAFAPAPGADLLVLKARSYSEMLARHQFDRAVLRAGRAIDTTLPDYRELDDLMAPL